MAIVRGEELIVGFGFGNDIGKEGGEAHETITVRGRRREGE